MQSFLDLCGFVLGGFANSLCRPEYSSTSVGRFSGSERQTCATNGRGLQGILHDVQGAEYREETTPRHSASAKKIKAKNAKILSFFFLKEGGLVKLFSGFR